MISKPTSVDKQPTGDEMATLHAVLAAGWIPFVISLVVILVFSFLYVRYYKSHYDTNASSTVATVLGIAVSLFTCALVPVDIFLVSYMKDSDVQFKEWAKHNESRQSIVDAVLYTYYAMYACLIVFLFFILPLTYFYYEEGDEDTSSTGRCCNAMKYTVVFILFAVALLLVGMFLPFRPFTPSNGTQWDEVKNLFANLNSNHGEDATSFAVSTMTSAGWLALIVYTAYGMSAWPVDLMRGSRSTAAERMDAVEALDDTRSRIQRITRRYTRRTSRMSPHDRQQLEYLEDREQLIERQQDHLVANESSCLHRCGAVLRPFTIAVAILLLLVAALVIVSLVLTNVDKIMHSLGPRMGYALPERKLPNPIDIVLVYAQRVFPLDYILIAGFVLYLFLCSMAGIQRLGIWFCCIRVYKVRVGHTRPQGLLFLCFFLIFIVLALNVLVYEVAPQYTTYGSQHYWANVTHAGENTTQDLVPCNISASEDECVMTRMAMLLVRFFYKVWIFGAAFYWASWLFVAAFVVGFLVSIIKRRQSPIEGEVDSDDFYDSDDDMLQP